MMPSLKHRREREANSMTKKRLTAEEKKQIEERKRRENEVKALFDEHDEIYGKKRYVPRVAELLIFLKNKKNAKAFWENPHIKMIYNVSDHLNFLLSIYTQETDNEKYEKWLRNNFSNPFFDKVIVNYEMVQNHYRINESDKHYLFNFFIDISNPQFDIFGYESFKRKLMDEHEIIARKYSLLKYVPLDSLLDRDYYQSLITTDCQLPEIIKNAQSSVKHVDKVLNEVHMLLSAEEIDFLKISKRFLLVFETLFFGNDLFSHKDYSSPERTSLIRETSEEYDTLLLRDPMNDYYNKDLDDDYFDKKYKFFVERYNNLSNLNEKIRNEVEVIARESANNILFVHPLIAMDNVFLRLDVYNVWKNAHRNQWSKVIIKDLDMFKILDALVESRKYYLKEINK